MLGIVYALTAAACWGTSDFVGGLFSRRLSVLVVLFTVELSGMVLVLVAVALAGDSFPDARAAVAALLAGTAGIAALGAFYRALAIGTMSIVAPVSATGIALPVIVGIATGDRPSALVALGIVLTVAGVVLATREVEQGEGGPSRAAARASIVLALVAALGFGTFFIGYDVASDASVLWATLLARTVAVPAVALLVLVRGERLPGRRDAVALCGAGVIDVSATFFYALANTHAPLSVVAVVGSMYPVATVLLARAVLHERLRGLQAIGVAAALAGVAMMAAG